VRTFSTSAPLTVVMHRPRWRKVVSDLIANPTRSALVTASIAVGLFALGIITNNYAILTADMEAGYRLTNPANIQIFSTTFETKLIDRIERVRGVQNAEGRYIFTLQTRNRSGEWESINLEAFDDFSTARINQVKIISGEWNPAKHEIVIDRYKLKDLPVGLGGEIEIKLPSGSIRRLKLVGIVQDQSIGSSGGAGGFFLAPAQGYINQEDLPWLDQSLMFNTLLVTAEGNNDDPKELQTLANRVMDEVEQNGQSVINATIRTSGNHPNSSYVEAIASILFVLSLLIVFLSGFLITNTLQALLAQQVNQIAIMKIVGGRRKQIIWLYIGLILIFSIVALILAVPMAFFASSGLLKFLSESVNFRVLKYRLAPSTVAFQTIIALVVPQVAAIFPILQGVKITIQRAIGGQVEESKQSWVDVKIRQLRILSRPQRISVRNTFRRKGRLVLTLVTLALGGAIFASTFNVRYSVQNYVARVSHYFLADVNLTFQKSYRVEEIEQVLKEVPDVNYVEGWAFTRGEILADDGTALDSVQFVGPPVGTPLVEPIILRGRWVEPGDVDSVALSERFLTLFPDLEIGDAIQFKVNGEENRWTVIGIFQLAGKSAGYMAYTSFQDLSDLLHSRQNAFTYRILSSRENLTLEEQKALARVIEAHMEARGYDVQESSAGLLLSESTTDGLNIVTTFLMIMALLTALVGSIGLAGTMSMNVLERTREIGIMRAIGATNRIIMQLVIGEGILIGIMSWILSGFISLPISKLLTDTINQSLFGTTTEFVYSPIGVVVWLGIVLALSILACVIPARSAARLTIREVLAYE